MMTLTHERLRQLFSYNPENGNLTYLVSRGPRRAGQIAGCKNKVSGYRQLTIDGAHYYAHQLAWLYITGRWPEAQIDHRNGIRDDNRWANLREATNGQNSANSRKNRNNTSGFKGVRRSKSGRWEARIGIDGKQRQIGTFDTLEVARRVYALAARIVYSEFARP